MFDGSDCTRKDKRGALMKAPSAKAVSRIIPNTFPMPNFYLDSGIWALLKPEEQSCLTFLARKTYGWWKQSDRIAYSQLEKVTGLGKSCVRKSMASLVRFGLATCLSGAHDAGNSSGQEWALQVEDQLVKYDLLNARQSAKQTLNAKRTRGLLHTSHETPNVPRDPSPNVPQQETPNVPRHPQKTYKPSNKPLPAGTKIPSRSSIICDALALHFKVTVRPAIIVDREFLKWAVDDVHMTPEQIAFARTKWNGDAELNWHGKCMNPNLSIIQRDWLKAIDGFGKVTQEGDDDTDWGGLA
jgi:hypothetical protein